jgi:hypothetical protein
MILQLKENMLRGCLIQDSRDSVIKFQDRRDYLELMLKNHILDHRRAGAASADSEEDYE